MSNWTFIGEFSPLGLLPAISRAQFTLLGDSDREAARWYIKD